MAEKNKGVYQSVQLSYPFVSLHMKIQGFFMMLIM